MSGLKLKISQTLDIIIICTGYLIAVMNAYAGGETAVTAFIWGQVAMFWYFRIYSRKKKLEEKQAESKTESKPSEETASQDKPVDAGSPPQEKQEEK